MVACDDRGGEEKVVRRRVASIVKGRVNKCIEDDEGRQISPALAT